VAETIYAPVYPNPAGGTVRAPLDGENGDHGHRWTGYYHRFGWDDGRQVATSVRTVSLDEPAFVVRELRCVTRVESVVDDTPAALIARLTAGDRREGV
jgi:hypothetical protein